jgi:hypothetical protein
LLRAVDAMIQGRRLTLIDLARAWPHAERVRAPLKAEYRLLGNRHLHGERESIYAAMTHQKRCQGQFIKGQAVCKLSLTPLFCPKQKGVGGNFWAATGVVKGFLDTILRGSGGIKHGNI